MSPLFTGDCVGHVWGGLLSSPPSWVQAQDGTPLSRRVWDSFTPSSITPAPDRWTLAEWMEPVMKSGRRNDTQGSWDNGKAYRKWLWVQPQEVQEWGHCVHLLYLSTVLGEADTRDLSATWLRPSWRWVDRPRGKLSHWTKGVETLKDCLYSPLLYMASLTWVWASSRSWWWTGKPGVLQSMWSQRFGHDLATKLNWQTLHEDLELYIITSIGGKILANYCILKQFFLLKGSRVSLGQNRNQSHKVKIVTWTWIWSHMSWLLRFPSFEMSASIYSLLWWLLFPRGVCPAFPPKASHQKCVGMPVFTEGKLRVRGSKGFSQEEEMPTFRSPFVTQLPVHCILLLVTLESPGRSVGQALFLLWLTVVQIQGSHLLEELGFFIS